MKLKYVITILIVFLFSILLSFIFYINSPYQSALRTINNINDIKRVKSDVLPVRNSFLWYSEYHGEMETDIVDKSINYFAKKIIPQYRKIDNTNKYYEKNAHIIELLTGIDNFDDFNKIVKKAKSLGTDNLQMEYCKFVKDSVIRSEDCIKTVVAIQYEGIEKVYFSVNINYNIEKDLSPIKYGYVNDSIYKNMEEDDTEDYLDNTVEGIGRAL